MRADDSVKSSTILYLVHDLGDAATLRRVEMLQRGGADVVLAGFHRAAEPPAAVAGVKPLALGRTHDGRMMNRTLMVARARAAVPRIAPSLGRVDAILARNLEMLAIGVSMRERLGNHPPLAYELLDVHRLLLSPAVRGAALRYLEARLASHASLLVTSSPAFVDYYVTPLSGVRLPVHLAENKVFSETVAAPPPRPAGPPWRIGLFGALRDRRSVDLLKGVAARLGGRVEVVVRGRPSPAVFDDLPGELEKAPHVTFHGAYRAPDDLPAIYGDVHFVWAVDFYEAGQNSVWLRPNRLYEGGAFGAVPIVARGTETADFCTALGIGLPLEGDHAACLAEAMERMTAERYATLAARVAAVPRERFVAGRGECEALVRALLPREGAGGRLAA